MQSDSTATSSKVPQLVKQRHDRAVKGEVKMYKLFLIDYSMPDLDGIELVKMLR